MILFSMGWFRTSKENWLSLSRLPWWKRRLSCHSVHGCDCTFEVVLVGSTGKVTSICGMEELPGPWLVSYLRDGVIVSRRFEPPDRVLVPLEEIWPCEKRISPTWLNMLAAVSSVVDSIRPSSTFFWLVWWPWIAIRPSDLLYMTFVTSSKLWERNLCSGIVSAKSPTSVFTGDAQVVI